MSAPEMPFKLGSVIRSRQPVPEVAALTKFCEQQICTGKLPFTFNLTFNESAKRPLSAEEVATNLDRFYTILLRYTVHRHNYNRPSYRHLQPLLLAFLDQPGSKKKGKAVLSTKTVRPNELARGYHYHGVIIADKKIAPAVRALTSHSFQRLKFMSALSKANVHVKTFQCVPLTEMARWLSYASERALTSRDAGKAFEFMVYPNSLRERRRRFESAATNRRWELSDLVIERWGAAPAVCAPFQRAA